MKKNWIRILVLLLAIWTVGGTGCRKEEAPRFTLPDGSLDAGADDIAVCRGSLFCCSDGSLLMQSGEESEVLAFKLTEDDRDAYLAFLDAIDGVLATDTPVWEIYAEECFDGRDRKPEDVAAVIQSRVAILLAERS